MKRTMIVTIETEGDDEWRRMEEVEEEFLTMCDNLANSSDASVNAELCVDPLSDTLISKLCNSNTGREQ